MRAFLTAALILLAVPAWADFEEGLSLYRRAYYASALREFRKLADQGHARAQYRLGLMYENGLGVRQDYAEAMTWWHKAAEQGLAKAHYALGYRYSEGVGTPQDYAQAYMRYALSAAQGDEKASKALDIIAEKMTPAQLSEARRMTREWQEKRRE